MRTQGKITHWNEQKGYGFITPATGAKQVFVHIRAFENRQERPNLNQIVSFSLSKDKQGRPCAVNVTIAGKKRPKGTKHKGSRSYSRSKKMGNLVTLALVAYIGWFAYTRLIQPQTQDGLIPQTTVMEKRSVPKAKSSRFKCDGRTYCSHMTSCAEAKYFIKHCPNTKMDGDRDGVPCESQWCN